MIYYVRKTILSSTFSMTKNRNRKKALCPKVKHFELRQLETLTSCSKTIMSSITCACYTDTPWGSRLLGHENNIHHHNWLWQENNKKKHLGLWGGQMLLNEKKKEALLPVNPSSPTLRLWCNAFGNSLQSDVLHRTSLTYRLIWLHLLPSTWKWFKVCDVWRYSPQGVLGLRTLTRGCTDVYKKDLTCKRRIIIILSILHSVHSQNYSSLLPCLDLQ